MIAYIIRRFLYAIPILLGVNILTFLLFFSVNTPDDIARMHLGEKHVTEQDVTNWKSLHGYDEPYYYNGKASGVGVFTQTMFFNKSLKLFSFEFGTGLLSNSPTVVSFEVTPLFSNCFIIIYFFIQGTLLV